MLGYAAIGVLVTSMFVDGAYSSQRVAVGDDRLLIKTPMVMTHDSGSGYLGKGLVNRWTKTQVRYIGTVCFLRHV